MKKSEHNKTDFQIKNDLKSIDIDNRLKTTNINVLLNRVRLEKKKK